MDNQEHPKAKHHWDILRHLREMISHKTPELASNEGTELPDITTSLLYWGVGSMHVFLT